jgi:hypothetical protein
MSHVKDKEEICTGRRMNHFLNKARLRQKIEENPQENPDNECDSSSL